MPFISAVAGAAFLAGAFFLGAADLPSAAVSSSINSFDTDILTDAEIF
jgi:hypothetical protein